ncbi:hypothetical protein AB6A40_007761 [Gnathostoma spinigerum]|uniref:J domain-containing protein n=1 Tax=Gnathostoma spinigerum TaxID=75299 RepID=A0ABD6EWU8_9BILA
MPKRSFIFSAKKVVTSTKMSTKIKEGCPHSVSCWNCHKSVDCVKEKFFCPACSAIQPIQAGNFFEFLGVQPSYDVDVASVKKNFIKLQSKIHPDKFTSCSEKEKKLSEDYSAVLNDAYGTITEPLRRARYLLKLKGQCLSEETMSSDHTFLTSMMELNEEIESLEDADAIKNMIEKMEDKIDQLAHDFRSCTVCKQREERWEKNTEELNITFEEIGLSELRVAYYEGRDIWMFYEEYGAYCNLIEL